MSNPLVKPLLTPPDYEAAAVELQCEVAAIQAVAQVESRGNGFQQDGRLKILFERHHFSRLTKRKYDKTHSHISSTDPGGYTKNEWARFVEAAALNADAAAQSTSWGKFQTMGFNHKACGYVSAEAMVADYDTGEPAQLRGFVNFIESSPGLLRALRNKNWATFAKLYNGPNYAINKYDLKMASAYRDFNALAKQVLGA